MEKLTEIFGRKLYGNKPLFRTMHTIIEMGCRKMYCHNMNWINWQNNVCSPKTYFTVEVENFQFVLSISKLYILNASLLKLNDFAGNDMESHHLENCRRVWRIMLRAQIHIILTAFSSLRIRFNIAAVIETSVSNTRGWYVKSHDNGIHPCQ